MKRYARVFLLFMLPFFVHGDDRETLRSLSKSLPTSKWNTRDQNPCFWGGITCSPSSQVTHLSLSALSLSTPNTTSTFFTLLCQFQSLQSLDLSINSFAFIPTSFFSNCTKLSGLKSLNLSYNSLTGSLSSFSSSFPNLESLDLSHNSFRGGVGSSLDGLFKLKSLNLSFNLFEGAIPLYVGLEKLVLSGNSFEGQIPNNISHSRNLTVLDLHQNRLSGSLPNGIGELSKLESLLLSSNFFIGEVPGSLSSIKTLTWFAANQNQLSGKIPTGITRYLRTLDLSYNQLDGGIPSDLLSSPNLESIDLSFNSLEGPIPGIFSQKLIRLRLGNNKLNGSVPVEFHQPPSLTYLELNNNGLVGNIPVQLEKFQNLTLLNLASNKLHGGLPKELGNLRQLVIMKLQENNLSGEIPNEFTRLSNLSTLNISQNSLNGAMPPEISGLKKLSVLHLGDNDLNGSIPFTIFTLGNLIELQLGKNKLSGRIPRMPTSLSSALNLSSNLFSGPIPSYFSDLSQLEILDLSNNNFSGQVPASLVQMQSLILLDLSNNQLSGTLPNFPHFVNITIAGNNALVYPPAITPIPSSTSSSKKKNSTLIIVVAVIGAVVGLGVAAAVVALMVSKRYYRVEDEGVQLGESPCQIVSGRFITSDSIHKSNIDFAKAMEVVGIPSNIMLKTKFSTYYKAVMPSSVSYTVKKLNWSEKIFQSGSRERFGQELEVLGRLSNSNVMVPLAYVLTEDSAYLFYEHVQKGTVFDFLHRGFESGLDWQSRYSIALGIAQGLTFLHGCTQPVLLLDLSTMSIHLKSKKEPQIGDIELCKVIDPSKSTGSISTVAGSVGYIPPEYAYTMRVTMAGNVYSFGVLLLELLTGKPPVSEGTELAKWALGFSSRPDQREQILDPSISKTSIAVRSQMLSVLKVALSCVKLSPDERPKMRNVLRMLFNAR